MCIMYRNNMCHMHYSAASTMGTACSFARFINIAVILGTIMTVVSIIFALVSVVSVSVVVSVVGLITAVLVLILEVLIIKK